MKIVILGASGLIGRKLVGELFRQGHEISCISRREDPPFIRGVSSWEKWDGNDVEFLANLIESKDVLINLAGEKIAQWWTPRVKARLIRSRKEWTQKISQAMGLAKNAPRTWVNTSAVGFYGDGGDNKLSEKSPAGNGFLAKLCEDWEHAVSAKSRVVIMRVGLVLAAQGGILPILRRFFRLYLGTVPGDGKNWIPWVHLDDVISAYIFAIENPEIKGPVNVVSPTPIRAENFYALLAKNLKRPILLGIPAKLLKMFFKEQSGMLLFSQCVIPEKLMHLGFKYRWKDYETALRKLLEGFPK